MNELKIGTRVKIKSEEELKELFDREYNRRNGEWNKKTEKSSDTIVFLDAMLQCCGRECTIASNFTGLGYYMEEIGCYWNPDWFDVIKKPPIGVGDTVVLKSLIEAAEYTEILSSFIYTFGKLTCDDMWGKEFYVNQADDKKITIEKKNGEHIYIPHEWASKIIPAEENYRRVIEKYISEHNFEKELPGKDAPYDWSIEINKQHHFINAFVFVDGYKFRVYEGYDEMFKVERV